MNKYDEFLVDTIGMLLALILVFWSDSETIAYAAVTIECGFGYLIGNGLRKLDK